MQLRQLSIYKTNKETKRKFELKSKSCLYCIDINADHCNWENVRKESFFQSKNDNFFIVTITYFDKGLTGTILGIEHAHNSVNKGPNLKLRKLTL